VTGSDAAAGGPEISVVIPTFQRRALTLRAVRSVLSQSFRDFELIVVDGGSDGTDEALSGLDDRIRYVRHENRGPAAARNAGIALARGELVAFLDSDNQWLPDHLSVLLDVFARHPSAVLVSTCPQFVVAGGEQPADARVYDALPGMVRANTIGYVSCVAVRRDALTAIEGFDETLAVAEDDDLWLRLAFCGPFAAIRRRTIIHQTTRASLKEQARRSGAFVDARARVLTRAIDELPRFGREDLVPRAQMGLELASFLRALGRRDVEGAGAALRTAVALEPELDRDTALLVGRIKNSCWGSSELLYRFASAATLWPDPGADTPLFLRAYSVMLALRAGRLATAARLVAARPRCLGPPLLLRHRRQIGRLSRNWLYQRIHRG
jgi:glycosyltransferase involved in cell wall biosynthesis